MKRVQILIVAIFLALAGVGFALRGQIRDLFYSASQPQLPPAVVYLPSTSTPSVSRATTTTSDNISGAPIAAESVPSADKTPTKSVPPDDPLTWTGELPAEINLKVPFLLQAPKQNWVQPFEDACEEASLIMVDAYYRGRTANYGADEGVETILKVVAYEDAEYGYNQDTNSAEVAHTAQKYFGYRNAIVTEATEAKIKAALASGYPVIVPAYGKALFNPNFRNGGPDYHMLVIKGYTRDGKWITNDPGTRRGADYVYSNDVLMNAIHEFNPEDMRQGRKTMIVVLPEK